MASPHETPSANPLPSHEFQSLVLSIQPPTFPLQRGSYCMRCFSAWGITRVQHVCRCCFREVCWKCSANKASIRSIKQIDKRVCDYCFVHLQKDDVCISRLVPYLSSPDEMLKLQALSEITLLLQDDKTINHIFDYNLLGPLLSLILVPQGELQTQIPKHIQIWATGILSLVLSKNVSCKNLLDNSHDIQIFIGLIESEDESLLLEVSKCLAFFAMKGQNYALTSAAFDPILRLLGHTTLEIAQWACMAIYYTVTGLKKLGNDCEIKGIVSVVPLLRSTDITILRFATGIIEIVTMNCVNKLALSSTSGVAELQNLLFYPDHAVSHNALGALINLASADTLDHRLLREMRHDILISMQKIIHHPRGANFRQPVFPSGRERKDSPNRIRSSSLPKPIERSSKNTYTPSPSPQRLTPQNSPQQVQRIATSPSFQPQYLETNPQNIAQSLSPLQNLAVESFHETSRLTPSSNPSTPQKEDELLRSKNYELEELKLRVKTLNEENEKLMLKMIKLEKEKEQTEISAVQLTEAARSRVIELEKLLLPQITFSEIQDQKKTTQGKRAWIYKAMYRSTQVAVKKFEFNSEHQLSKEAQLLSIKHPNIASFLGILKDPFAFVFEWVAQGPLFQYIKTKKLPTREKIRVASEIATGMAYLHGSNPPIIHSRLNSSNILLDSEAHAKIINFGVSGLDTVTQSKYHPEEYPWLAPEVLNKIGPLTTQVDVFSFAIILWELANWKAPYEEIPLRDLLVNLTNGKRPDVEEDHILNNLIQKCWAEDPSSRPSFPEILSELSLIPVDPHGAPQQFFYPISREPRATEQLHPKLVIQQSVVTAESLHINHRY